LLIRKEKIYTVSPKLSFIEGENQQIVCAQVRNLKGSTELWGTLAFNNNPYWELPNQAPNIIRGARQNETETFLSFDCSHPITSNHGAFAQGVDNRSLACRHKVDQGQWLRLKTQGTCDVSPIDQCTAVCFIAAQHAVGKFAHHPIQIS